MLEIDGGIGEGGGQILRTAIAISSLTLKPLKIVNIRKNRPNPGLRPQHLTTIKVLAEFTKAETIGLSIGSTELYFKPTRKIPLSKSFNIGTAGSLSLLLQAITPFCISLSKPIKLDLIGGTNVKWSPPIDYIQRVLIPLLEKMGIKFTVELVRRGFYPKGGGKIRVLFNPVKKIKPVVLPMHQKIKHIGGVSYASNLPAHVIHRQSTSAKITLEKSGILDNTGYIDIVEEKPVSTLSPGSGILLYAILEEGGILGSDALGERGIKAEKVGEKAARSLVEQLKTGATVDKNMADMILPYMAFSSGRSVIYAPELTSHAKTNIHVLESILDVKFHISQLENNVVKIETNGIGIDDFSLL
ncbi:MAG: RNA 3'-terminal phosphate cyclase [Candidatus Odinarchaeia archaeon]